MIGALVGAAGAVTAQIVAATFTARREKTRLEWERTRAHEERLDRSKDRFLDLKLEAFSQFLAGVHTMMRDRLRLHPTEWEKTAQTMRSQLHETRNLLPELSLISPPVHEKAWELLMYVQQNVVNDIEQEERSCRRRGIASTTRARVDELTRDCEHAMRSALGHVDGGNS